MQINANLKELQLLAKRFYTITGSTISIYDNEKKQLCFYPKKQNNFCTFVRKNKILDKTCIRSDEMGFEVCTKTKKTYIYKCHMGLIEVVTPIMYGNIIIGYVLFGQINDQKDTSHLRPLASAVAEEFNIDKAKLLSALETVKKRSAEYIESVAVLLEMCANYIWLNSLMSVKNEGTAYSIDTYIRSHLKYELDVNSLCREFGVGRSSLYELSKKHFHCSITNYVQTCRIEHARELLKKDYTVSEVAEEVGIPDTSYFIRFFKKHTGITPKQFQKNFKI